ncbi:hypothetical protein [Egbenema bharatensis]|uniref:hypothetical protein n=1 Tax=Egbenema bharatensis TaxID=3463334 RepID=UPI003A8B067F
MARTRKRSSASASVSQSAIETTRSTLNELETKPKENLSLREAIGELHESITDALNRGYSYEEVVEILATQGVTITVASLKRYLAAARKEVSDKPKRTRRTSNRSRKTQLAKQSADLSDAASPDEAPPSPDAAEAASEVAEPTKKRRTTSRAKSSSTTASRTRSAAKTKTAAKAKPTSRSKTTTSRPSGRGRKRSSAAE